MCVCVSVLFLFVAAALLVDLPLFFLCVDCCVCTARVSICAFCSLRLMCCCVLAVACLAALSARKCESALLWRVSP